MWIRARPGRSHANYQKDELNQQVARQWETCTKIECRMYDKVNLILTRCSSLSLHFLSHCLHHHYFQITFPFIDVFSTILF
jgi:hypothetical protein